MLPAGEGSIVVDVSAGLPQIASDEFQLVGDLTLGYSAENIGVIGSAGLSVYDFKRDIAISKNRVVRGQLEGWYLTGDAQSP